jgi:general secretion pathway protein C
MTTLDQTLWPARLSTFILAALAAASVVYWGLRWSEPISTPRANGDGFSQRPLDTGRIAQLLGASATPANAPAVNATAQYKLLGVIAGAKGRSFGSALIAIDSEPAKPYKVGDRLSDDLLLQSVTARGATLAPGMQEPASVELELPPLATIKSR